jgi:hypothetical protein
MTRLTDELIGDLVADAPAVRRIARLRWVAAAAVGAALAAASLRVGIAGIRPDLAGLAPPVWLVLVVLGLAVTSLGGLAAGLGAGVPGREGVTLIGLAAALTGLAVAVATAAAPWVLSSVVAPAGDARLADACSCIGIASFVGIPPALILAWFLRGAWPARPIFALAAACGGAVGLGALAVQSSCPIDTAFHVLVAHTLAPMIGGALILVLLPLAIRVGIDRQV